ncbi:hypothetical protein LEMLEM_LOCUS4872, partial [Lemmus lemmus]
LLFIIFIFFNSKGCGRDTCLKFSAFDRLKQDNLSRVVMAHIFNPSIWEAEAGGSL